MFTDFFKHFKCSVKIATGHYDLYVTYKEAKIDMRFKG